MSQLIPSDRDLAIPGNGANAVYELRRAVDLGGVADRAAWLDRWGDAVAAFFTDAPVRLEEDIRDTIDQALARAISDINDVESDLRSLRHELKEA